MTAIVGIKCTDGVVVGADSAATLGDGGALVTIEQLMHDKVKVIGDTYIVAGAGYVGHHQRYCDAVGKAFRGNKFKGLSKLDVARNLSVAGVQDFSKTGAPLNFYSALVAYPAGHQAHLCELQGPMGFQPEVKSDDDLWFASMGSGQLITDSLLAFFRDTLWIDGPPDLEGGVFAAVWALRHACDVSPSGIQHPIHIATLSMEGRKFVARKLSSGEIEGQMEELGNASRYMSEYMSKYKREGLGIPDAPAPQPPPDE